MFGFKRKLRAAEIKTLQAELLRVALGMLRSGKSAPEISDFLVNLIIAKRVPTTTGSEIITSVFAQLNSIVPVLGPQPSGAVEKEINGSTYVDVTNKTHCGVRPLTAEEFKAELKKREEKKPDPSQATGNSGSAC